MNKITLKEYLKTHTQFDAANAIGCTQGAIPQMLKVERKIMFRMDGENVRSVYEIKEISPHSPAVKILAKC